MKSNPAGGLSKTKENSKTIQPVNLTRYAPGSIMNDERKVSGGRVGEFIPPREVPEYDPDTDKLPPQEEFFRPPVRFGSVPVEEKPLGFDARRGYKKLFPPIMLPTQVVERVSFGHPELEPNRLFWGDNLHVMRSLPSESIDLIYIDPPFFSGRNYNVIFGGGCPGNS